MVMRRGDFDQAAAAVREPIRRFVREARVRLALLITGSGQVLGQHGFTGGVQVINVASLAAAAHASARALGEITGSGRWQHLHHGGRELQLFLAPFRTAGEELILIAIFEKDSSIGLVRLFFDEFASEIAVLPEFQASALLASNADSAETFESDLERGLRSILAPKGNDER